MGPYRGFHGSKGCDKIGFFRTSRCQSLAALATTQLCKELGVDWIQFMGDAKVVVDAALLGDQDVIKYPPICNLTISNLAP